MQRPTAPLSTAGPFAYHRPMPSPLTAAAFDKLVAQETATLATLLSAPRRSVLVIVIATDDDGVAEAHVAERVLPSQREAINRGVAGMAAAL